MSEEKRNPNFAAYLGLAVNFGITMIASMMLGAWVGGKIDEWLGSPQIFTFFGLICGVITGFKVMLEQIEHLDKKRKY